MSRCFASFAAALLWTTAAIAQTDAATLGRAEALIRAAMDEHRLFQTCLALVPGSGTDELWTGMAARTIEVLRPHAGTEALIARLEAAGAPGALRLPDETSFAELRDLCTADPDWMIRLNRFQFIQLHDEIRDLF